MYINVVLNDAMVHLRVYIGTALKVAHDDDGLTLDPAAASAHAWTPVMSETRWIIQISTR